MQGQAMQRSGSMNTGSGTATPALQKRSMQRVVTRALLLMAAMVMLASCGGDSAEDGASPVSEQIAGSAEAGTAGEGGSGSVSSVSYGSVFRVAFDVTDRFGGVDGYAAVVTALDRGYTLDQVLSGSADLGRDGWIAIGGEQIPPQGSPRRLLGPVPEVDEGLDGEGEPMRRQSSSLKQDDERQDRDEYVGFIGDTLDEIHARTLGRVRYDMSGEEVDRMVDDILERSRIDAEFDALFADDPDEMDELEDLEESEVWATTLTLLLVGQGYSLEDALQAGLLGTFEARGPCLLIPGASRQTALRMAGCEEVELEDAPSDDEPGDSAPEETEAEDVESPASGLVDSGKTVWSGEMTPRPDARTSVTVGDVTVTREYPVTYPEGFVEITRMPGTDDFTISIDTTVESATDYALSGDALEALLAADVIDSFYPNFCETSTNSTFEGTGTFEGDTSRSSYFIVFRGRQQRIEVRACELEDLDPYEDVGEGEYWVEVTADGLSLSYGSYEVLLPGPAAPLAG